MNKEKGKVIPMDPALRKRKQKNRHVPPLSKSQSSMPKKNSREKKLRLHTESIQEFKRGRAINRSTTFVAGLFFIFVLVYLLRTLFTFFNTPEIPVSMVRMGSVDAPVVVEGIIIRDETVYTAARDGVVHFYVNYYDRVRPGTVVASIQNLQEADGIQRSISQVELDLIRLQEVRGNLSAADPAIQRINGQISNMVDQRLSRHIQFNMSEVYSLRDAIVQNVNMRNQIIVAENLNANVRAELGVNHQMLMNQLDANRLNVTVGGGGIIVPTVDGFEEQLTFQNMYYLNQNMTRQNIDFSQFLPRREVEYGDGIFKVVNSNIWYIAAHIPNDLVEDMNTRDTVTLYIEGQREPLSVQVHNMEPGFQETFVIFRSTRYMHNFFDTRSIFFRTTDTVQDGLRIANTAITEEEHLIIPLSAIHEGDEDQLYVIRVIGYEDIKVPISSVSMQDDYFAFVLSKEHEILSAGNTLRERGKPDSTRIITEQPLTGVFRVNNGIATFATIYIRPEDPVGGVYTIINPALNPSLRLYDHIVTDAALVRHGDIVFSGVR